MEKKEGYLGKLPSVKGFFREYNATWWIVGVFLFITYGIKVFQVSLSHDTEAIIAVPDRLYESWYSMGRFGEMFLKRIFGTYVFNPYSASFLMVVAMFFNSVLWTYLFDWIGKRKKSMVYTSWIFPSFFFTSMIMGEQSGFLLQAFEVNVALFLVGTALLCVFKAFLQNRGVRWCLPAVFCCVIAFATYQTLVPFFTASAAVCFIMLYDRLSDETGEKPEFRFYLILIGKMIAVFLISFVVYQLLNRCILFLLGMETTSYITGQIKWGTEPVRKCIYYILRHIYCAIFGRRLFYNGANAVICFGILIYAVNRFRRREKGYILYFAAVVYALVSPFLMSLLLGTEPTMRTQMLLPFVMGFFLQYLVRKVKEEQRVSAHGPAMPVMVCVAFIVLHQSLLTARLYYTQYMQYEEDVQLAVKITDRIERLGLGEIPEEPVVFVGERIPSQNPSCIKRDQLELIGRSFFEVSYDTYHGSWVMLNFLVTQGHPYTRPTTGQAEVAEAAAEKMPSWPEDGCVAVRDGIIVVKWN